MDEMDREQQNQEAELQRHITAARGDIPEGEPGDCTECGEPSSRLVYGECVECRSMTEEKQRGCR